MYLKRDVSWYPFFTDFGTVLGGPGEAKKLFSHWSGYDFKILGSSNISSLLECQKHQFWEPFGGQVGYQKCVRWLQEASWAEITKLFWGSQKDLKK